MTVPKPGLGNFALLLTSSGIHRILLTTLRISIITSSIALVLGYLISYVMVHTTPQHRTWILFVVLLSFWLSVLIRAYWAFKSIRGIFTGAVLWRTRPARKRPSGPGHPS